MQIIGAGWGRTGTTSLTAALEQLGAGPCLHMKKMWDKPAIADAFARHLDGDPVEWPTVLAGFAATIHPGTRPGADLGPPYMRALMDRLWAEDFGGWDRVLDRDAAIRAFVRHNDEVRAQCPSDRLLEWTVSDGWAPICAALGVDVPDRPFPHRNDRASFAGDTGDSE